MFNWFKQAAGAVGNLFNQGSRYVGSTFNNADRQRRIWEQQARQAVPQVQRQVQQQVQQLPKPPQVDFSAVIKNLQALRNQPQVNNAIRAANPVNQFKSQANAINQSIVRPLNQYGQNQLMKQYGLNQQQLTDLQNKSVVDRLKFGITRPAQLNIQNPAQAIMGSPLNPLGGQAAFQVFNQSPVNIPKPDLTKMADDASASIARSRVGKNPIIGFAGENIVRPIIKSGARYADVTTGQEKYQPGAKGLAQLGTDTFNIGSTVYTPLGAGKLAQGGKVALKAAPGAFGRGALAGGGISALNQYADTGQIDPKNVALSALLGGAGNTLLPVAFGGLGRTGTKALANVRKPDLNAKITVPSLAEKGRLLQQGYKNVEVVVPNRPVNALQTRYEQLRNAGATNTPEYRAVQQELQKAGIGLPDTPRLPIAQNAPKSNIDDLLNEAKKYKSAEEFGASLKPEQIQAIKQAYPNKGILDAVETVYGKPTSKVASGKLETLNPTGGVYTEHTPKTRATIPLGDNIKTLAHTTGKNPDEIVTIYRGAPKNQKGINPGDFITTDPNLAKTYTGDGNIISKKVRLGDVLDDVTEPGGGEYIYRPKADKQLTDLYNQATKNKPIYELAPKPDAQVKANRGLIESVKESPMTKASLRNALESEQYTVLPNKLTMEQAVKTINKNPQAALNEVLSTKPRTAQLNAQGLILAEKAQKRGDFETAQQIFKAMAPGNTKEGQAIQILSVWSKTKPEGVVKYAQKVVDDANNTLIVAGKNPSVTLSAEKAAGFRKQAEAIAKMPEGKDKLIATQKMLNEIHQQVPASIAEKAQSLLYYAQLLNPKTAVRNIIGNTGFALGETAKDIVGAPIDATLTGVRRLLGQDAQRSIYLPNPVKQIRAGLAGGVEAAKEARVGVNLSGLEGQLQIGNKQPAFRNPIGRGLDKAMQFELSVPDRTFYTSRYQQTLDNLMKGAKVSKPTKEMLDIADYDAKYATFQDDSLAAKAFMNIKKGLNLNKDFGVGSFVINYPKTPGNLLARGIDYSPAGFVKSTLEIAKPLFRQGPFNQKKFVDSFSRALVGTGGLIGTGALLHKAGIITGAPSKDKDVNAQDKATGLGAYRINIDALKRFITSGFKPQKLEDGDTTISYDWFQPAAIGISMGANIDETQASDKGAVGKLVKMLGTGGASVAAGAETLANQPLVQGLTKLTGNGGGITQGVLAIAQGVPASFVPTLLNQVNQLVDNTSRSTYDPNPAVQGINMVKAKIPGLAQTLQPQVNPEGQNNERYQNGSNNPFNVFLNPAFVGTYNADNVQKEITRLENSTGQTSQYPSIIKNTQKVNGQDVQLSPQQVTDMQRVQGQLTKEAYAKIMSDPAYSRLSDTDKVKKLQNIITQANQIARSQVLSDQNGRDQISVTAEGKKPKVAKAPKAKKPKKGRTARKGRSTKVAKTPSIRLSAPRKVATAKVAKLRAPRVKYQRLAKSSKTPRIKV